MAKLINKIFLSIIILASTSCAAKKQELDESFSLEFDNTLNQCVVIKDYSSNTIKNTVLLNVEYEQFQSIGHCGCKSALAQYRVNSEHQELATGLLDFRNSNSLNLTLSNTESLLASSLAIEITCSQPQ